jgi:putative SOS response-associated peptidase YedK
MCGRFGLTHEASRALAYLLGVDEADLSFHRPRYNIAPTQEHFVLISEYERRKILPARWGLVNSGAKDNSRAAQCINAMVETVEVKPSYREAFRQRRCIVPADGDICLSRVSSQCCGMSPSEGMQEGLRGTEGSRPRVTAR